MLWSDLLTDNIHILAQVFPKIISITDRNDPGIACDFSIPPGLYPGISIITGLTGASVPPNNSKLHIEITWDHL